MSLKNFCCPEVMVVDDIDYNRFALVAILKSIFDIDSDEATNGQECIDKIKVYDKKTCCDGIKIIVMDFEMPVLNGLEVSIN
jgi:CheY-like chemotaxis protein